MIKIGYNAVGIFDNKFERSIIKIDKPGILIFNGRSFLGSGTRLAISGICKIGTNTNISGNTAICCSERIFFGDDSLISWDCLIMDTDFWIRAKSTILKGTRVSDGCIIGAGCLVSGEIEGKNIIATGNPISILKNNISWEI